MKRPSGPTWTGRAACEPRPRTAEIEAGEVAGNRRRAVESIATAGDRNADLVVLPEIFAVGYFGFDSARRVAKPVVGETVGELVTAAADHGLAVLAGTIVEDLAASRADGTATPVAEGLADAAVLLDREERRQAVYRNHTCSVTARPSRTS